jgi:hypothetical protein
MLMALNMGEIDSLRKTEIASGIKKRSDNFAPRSLLIGLTP